MKSKPSQKKADFASLLEQGTAVLHQGNIAEATSLLEQAYQLDKQHEAAALNLAGAYILSKKFKQAVAILEPLSEREPDNPMIWTNLGAAYLGNPVLAKEEHQQQAIMAFERALEIDSRTPNIAYNLGLIYRDRQETALALHWFQQALKANPNDKDAAHYIRTLNKSVNRPDEEDVQGEDSHGSRST